MTWNDVDLSKAGIPKNEYCMIEINDSSEVKLLAIIKGGE